MSVDPQDLEGLIPHELGIALYELAWEVPGGEAVVELGSFKGKSTCYLASGARAGYGAHVWAFDPWDLPGNITGRFGFAEKSTYEAFLSQVANAGLESQITATKQFGAVAAEEWEGPPVGLLYIDGDHREESVREDFWAWLPHLVPGSKVAFDDLDTPKNPGVRVVYDELVKGGALLEPHVRAERLAIGRVPW